jgi:hypothetical protein
MPNAEHDSDLSLQIETQPFHPIIMMFDQSLNVA